MLYNRPLHETINTNEPVTKTLLTRWNTATTDLLNRGIQGETPIEPVVANRYKYDFYGLLLFMGVDQKYHYPHLLVNGYSNPTQYAGKGASIKLISLTLLAQYHTAFTRQLSLL